MWSHISAVYTCDIWPARARGGSASGQFAVELAQPVLTIGDKTSEVAAQGRRNGRVACLPPLHPAADGAEIARQLGVPMLPIKGGTDTAEKVRGHSQNWLMSRPASTSGSFSRDPAGNRETLRTSLVAYDNQAQPDCRNRARCRLRDHA